MTPDFGLSFEPASHTYVLDGAVVPSVTGVLRRSGIINFDGVPAHILEAAQRRGTIVHSAIHYANDRDLDVDQFRADYPDLQGYLDAWLAFNEQRSFEPILNEHRIASRSHKVAGTVDCIGLLDGKPVLLDFATGRAHDVAKNLQTAAYHGIAMEWATEKECEPALRTFMSVHKYLRRFAVELRRDGTFRLEPYTDTTDWRKFIVLHQAQCIVDAHRGERVCDTEAA